MDYTVEIMLFQQIIHPREIIKGDVKMKILHAMPVLNVCIEILGTAECHWEKPRKYLMRNYAPKQFFGFQRFFYCKHTLVGNESSEMTLEKKNYYFPFKCKLPGHLPSSWKGDFGEIKYVANVIVKTPKGPPQVHSKELQVLPYRNLTFEEYLLLEMKTQVTRKFRFGLLSLGTVTASLWLPFCGIAAGQCLPVICRIENNSSVLFGGIIFVLTQIQIYRSKKPHYEVKTVRKDVCRVAKLTDIFRGIQEFYCILKIQRSTFPTAQFWRCSTCQLIYEVWAQIQGSLPSNSAYGYPNIDLPGTAIIVGTHPAISWDINKVTDDVMKTLLRAEDPIDIDPPPPVEVVEEILNTVDEEFTAEILSNVNNKSYEDDSHNDSILYSSV